MKKMMRMTMAAVLVVSLSSAGSLIASSVHSNDEAMFTPGGGGGYSYTQYMVKKLGLFQD